MLLLCVDSSSQACPTAAPEKPPHCATGKSFFSFVTLHALCRACNTVNIEILVCRKFGDFVKTR